MNQATPNAIDRLQNLYEQAPDPIRSQLRSILDELQATPTRHKQIQVATAEAGESEVSAPSTSVSNEDRTQQQIQLYLKEAGDYARMLIDASLDAVIAVDMLLRIVEFNPAAERAFGYTKSEVLGKSVEMLYAEPAEGWRVRVKTHDRGFSGEVHNRRKNGELFTSLVRSVKICNAEGEVIGVMGISRDITQQRTLENQNKQMLAALSMSNRELEQARIAADAANQAKDRFLANMGHEIRTPLTAVLGFTEILNESCKEQPAAAEAIGIIRRNGEHLLELLNELLDYSKLESGKMQIEHQPCELAPLLSCVVSQFRIAAEKNETAVKVTLAPDVPPVICTDQTRLRQIILNLVDNAIKFTRKGRVEIRAALLANTSGAGKSVMIEVIDSGVGMTSEQVADLFSPFTQADASTSRRFGGTGLGLAISRRLARLLGGDVTVQSNAGVGSNFTLTIPCALENLAEPTRPAPRQFLQARPLEGYQILAVDDCSDTRTLIDHFLQKFGANATLSAGGRADIERVAILHDADQFDAILMDMQMPEMDGYEVTRMLRERGWKAPIIALTADDVPQIKDQCLKAGCDTHAAKPIEWKQLVNTIRELVERRAERAAEPSPRKACEKIVRPVHTAVK